MTPAEGAFRFIAAGLAEDEAFEAWRDIMARMFSIRKTGIVDELPRGSVSAFLVGDVIANRSIFNAQIITRDRRRIDATPDHMVFQLYRSGGFAGEMNGDPIRISRGQIAVCDLRRPLDVHAMTSHTIGLSVPRHLLDGVNLERLASRLDPVRERLLAARMTALHQRLPTLAASEILAVTTELIAALRRLLDPSAATDTLHSGEFDSDLRTLAERIMIGLLASPELSPRMISERLQISRATLYRVFATSGGVMDHIWTLRLQAVREALCDPLEPRNLTRLAADHGFKNGSHLSRSFRKRYGMTPRDWRSQHMAYLQEAWPAGTTRLNQWWRELGR